MELFTQLTNQLSCAFFLSHGGFSRITAYIISSLRKLHVIILISFYLIIVNLAFQAFYSQCWLENGVRVITRALYFPIV